MPELLQALRGGTEILGYINPEKLSPCDRVAYYGHRTYIENNTELFGAHPTKRPSFVYTLRSADMEAHAKNYLGAAINYSELEVLAQKTLSQIDEGYAALMQNHIIADLDEFAAQSDFFTDNPKTLRKAFEYVLDHARLSTKDHFYDYDIPPLAGTFISAACHKWNAYASYHSNRVQLYLCPDSFDTKRNMFLAAHEYYPGHHLHYAVFKQTQTCGHLRSPMTAFAEGWANYGEYLSEQDVYTDPAHKLAWLDYRRIRALRILMDVQRMRDKQSKDQIQEIWDANMPLRLRDNFDEEYERIIGVQHFRHLSYVLGREAILTVRERLERELGEDFDEKHFHHVLLTLPIRGNKYLYEQVTAGLEMEVPVNLQSISTN